MNCTLQFFILAKKHLPHVFTTSDRTQRCWTLCGFLLVSLCLFEGGQVSFYFLGAPPFLNWTLGSGIMVQFWSQTQPAIGLRAQASLRATIVFIMLEQSTLSLILVWLPENAFKVIFICLTIASFLISSCPSVGMFLLNRDFLWDSQLGFHRISFRFVYRLKCCTSHILHRTLAVLWGILSLIRDQCRPLEWNHHVTRDNLMAGRESD